MEVCSLWTAVWNSFVWICPALGSLRLLHFGNQVGLKCTVGLAVRVPAHQRWGTGQLEVRDYCGPRQRLIHVALHMLSLPCGHP